ncbi:MAG TPA: hypothetical protein VFR58_13900, partial [Flavisolibacter sp.]|nr:hypothetical protein [Flavisolibacter sp.]
MKKIFLIFLPLLCMLPAFAQINLSQYSFIYRGKDKDSPALMSAIRQMPGGYTPDFPIAGETVLGNPFSSDRQTENFYSAFSYDTALVHFFATGIERQNLGRYEFRVLKNGETVVAGWTAVTVPADEKIARTISRKHINYLGGFRTEPGNF